MKKGIFSPGFGPMSVSLLITLTRSSMQVGQVIMNVLSDAWPFPSPSLAHLLVSPRVSVVCLFVSSPELVFFLFVCFQPWLVNDNVFP